MGGKSLHTSSAICLIFVLVPPHVEFYKMLITLFSKVSNKIWTHIWNVHKKLRCTYGVWRKGTCKIVCLPHNVGSQGKFLGNKLACRGGKSSLQQSRFARLFLLVPPQRFSIVKNTTAGYEIAAETATEDDAILHTHQTHSAISRLFYGHFLSIKSNRQNCINIIIFSISSSFVLLLLLVCTVSNINATFADYRGTSSEATVSTVPPDALILD
jgi:hypothetical protein